MTWLILEDEKDIHDVLLSMFEVWGVSGASFEDGMEALQWIDDVDRGLVKTFPQLAMLDIRLPTLSGIEIGARIRQSPYLGDMVIVLTTAYHLTPQAEADAIQTTGADLLLYKPLPSMEKLRALLNGLLEKRQKLRNPEGSSAEVAARS